MLMTRTSSVLITSMAGPIDVSHLFVLTNPVYQYHGYRGRDA